MSNTPIYGSTELAVNSANADVPVNNMVRAVERAANSTKEWTVAGDFTASQTEMAEGFVHKLNGSPASPFAFGVYPVARFFAVINNTGKTCTVYVQGQSGIGVALSAVLDAVVLLYSDGVNVVQVGLGPYSGARVKKSVDQIGANYTNGSGTVITWDAEDHDIGGYHDTVTNNQRLTIPPGLSGYFELTVGIDTLNDTADRSHYLWITKNGGSQKWGAASAIESGLAGFGFVVTTGPVSAVAGDYFEAYYITETDTVIDVISLNSFFAIRKVG